MVNLQPTDRSEGTTESFFEDLDDPETLGIFLDGIQSTYRGYNLEYVSRSVSRIGGRFAMRIVLKLVRPGPDKASPGVMHLVSYMTESADVTSKVLVFCLSSETGDLMQTCDEAARTFTFGGS